MKRVAMTLLTLMMLLLGSMFVPAKADADDWLGIGANILGGTLGVGLGGYGLGYGGYGGYGGFYGGYPYGGYGFGNGLGLYSTPTYGWGGVDWY